MIDPSGCRDFWIFWGPSSSHWGKIKTTGVPVGLTLFLSACCWWSYCPSILMQLPRFMKFFFVPLPCGKRLQTDTKSYGKIHHVPGVNYKWPFSIVKLPLESTDITISASSDWTNAVLFPLPLPLSTYLSISLSPRLSPPYDHNLSYVYMASYTIIYNHILFYTIIHYHTPCICIYNSLTLCKIWISQCTRIIIWKTHLKSTRPVRRLCPAPGLRTTFCLSTNFK